MQIFPPLWIFNLAHWLSLIVQPGGDGNGLATPPFVFIMHSHSFLLIWLYRWSILIDVCVAFVASKLQSRFIWQIIKCIGITEFYNLILLRNPNGVIKAFICLFRYCLGFFLVYLHSFLPFFVFGCAVQIVKPQQFISNPDNCIINGRRLEATHAVDNSLVCAPGIGRIPGSLCGRVVCRLKGLAVGSPAIPLRLPFFWGTVWRHNNKPI